ncbi:S1C family serine protease [Oryzihumus leptocrescens]|uniref:Putative serine protease PepD n=1 Tax=Oryzihumus leptocrescens TaxID=297536 RepID=A0A542ZEW7_9MICO|nr:trypsin-like peptidase domain-containing protein [Oryzihumus leptocrescens]TQL58851.1 putative serine protease PepD [Oryzihumus leptocrescens]
MTYGPVPPASEPQPTQPLWYGEHTAGPSQPAAPQNPAEPPPPVWTKAGADRDRRPRRLVELVSVAVLAAVLASGTTYAVTHTDTAATTTSTTSLGATQSAPVVQANPSSPDWAATSGVVVPSVVSISIDSQQGSAKGSGVIIDKSGHVVTNNHVVSGLGQGSQITVTLHDQRSYSASVVGTDPATDLAVIKLENAPSDLKPIAFGDATRLTVGEPVMAVGNPLGLAGTVTTGIVSALNRPVTTEDSSGGDQLGGSTGEPVVTNAIQTSAAINPGNSGGALVNAGGQLVGINSSIASVSGSSSGSQSGNIGIGFAIPVNEVKAIADQLIQTGKAQHAYLGVSSRDATVTDGSAKRSAAQIGQVVSGTPAADAGLKTGDAIIAVNGTPVSSAESLVAQIRERTVGEKVTLTVVRGGKQLQVPVTLAVRPDTNQ